MDYLDNLNPPQLEAVLYGDGPLLILAGAGSGKTRVITCRIAHLIRERGVASEISSRSRSRTRLPTRCGSGWSGCSIPINRLWISTFHSACVRILRLHHALGYKRIRHLR